MGSLLSACGTSTSTSSEASTLAIEIDAGQNAAPFQWFANDMQSAVGVSPKIIGLPFVGQYEKIVSEMITRSNVYDVLVFPPFFVGDSRAPRFVSDGRSPWNPARRATLAEVRRIDDVVLLRYALSARFRMN